MVAAGGTFGPEISLVREATERVGVSAVEMLVRQVPCLYHRDVTAHIPEYCGSIDYIVAYLTMFN